MRQLPKTESRSLFRNSLQALVFIAVVVSTPALATDIIIYREVPAHNPLDTTVPPGPALSVPAAREDLVLGAVPGKRLSDEAVGAVFGATQPGGPGFVDPQGGVGLNDGTRNDALSNLPNSGMGSFSSLGGLGGQIEGQVSKAVDSGIQALTNTMNSLGGQ